MRRIVLAAACVSALVSIPALAVDHIVTARNGPGGRHFDPSPISIGVGDTVTFKNDVAGLGFHNVTSDDGAVTSFHCSDACGNSPVGNPSANAWSSTVTFPTAGTIGYYCEAHGGTGGVGMSGIITVANASLPSISADPPTIDGSAEAGASMATAFAISNSGGATLDWTADSSSVGCVAPVNVPWIALDPTAGSVASGAAAANVDVTLDATSLTPGSYSANICVHSNDAAHDPLTLPVTFTVNTPDLIFANGFDG